MKKIIGLFFLCVALLSIQGISYAQSGAPNGINYQAVIRDNLGTLVANSPVAIRINIRQNSASGIVIFSEKHLVTTTQYGLVNFVIGAGTYLGLGGPFASINWGNGPYFLDLGVAFSGLPNPTTYMAYGTQQMMSVPFALYAKSSGNLLNQWKYGTGVPAVNLGTAGDYYLDTATGNVYSKTNGTTWILISNIMGPQGPLGLTGAQGIQGLPGPTGATGSIGLTGPAGATGAQGPQGIQGLPGTNGTNGAVGATGSIGLTGPAGATGPQGIQGLPGTNGTNGAAGATGPAGAQGIQGLPGTNGAVGATGPTGAQGIQGLPGTNGTNGAVGATGPIGLTGPAGAQGIQGLPGTNGTAVLNGITNPAAGIGVNGDFYINTATNTLFGPKANGAWPAGVSLIGPQGIQGLTGATGPAGAQGIQGLPGTNGAVGATGPTGAQGIQGLPGTNGTNGAVGATGPIGLTGPAGAQGIQGLLGTNGAVGATGPAGPQGIQGLPGTNGANGAVGATGPIGLTGPTGAQGIQGLPGTNGTNGATGATGPAGPQGIQGLPGTNGAVGATGPIGPAGAQGIQGLPGTNGAIGATGPAGPQGIQGITGPAGATGANGATGPTGPAGPQGATGPQGLQGIQGVAGPAGPAGQSNSGTNNLNLSLSSLLSNNGNNAHNLVDYRLDKQNNIVILLQTNGPNTIFGATTIANTSTLLLVKLDSLGNYIWHNSSINGYGWGNRAIAIDSLNNIYCSVGGDLFKFNSNGSLAWQVNVNGAGSYGITIDSQNNVITACGNMGNVCSCCPNFCGSNVIMRKYSPSGSVIWTYVICQGTTVFNATGSIPNITVAHDLISDNSNNIYFSYSAGGLNNVQGGKGIIKISSSGSPLWSAGGNTSYSFTSTLLCHMNNGTLACVSAYDFVINGTSGEAFILNDATGGIINSNANINQGITSFTRPIMYNNTINYAVKNGPYGADEFYRFSGSLSKLNLFLTANGTENSQKCLVDFTASGRAYFLFSRQTQNSLLPSAQLSEVDFNPISGNTGITIVKINP